MTEHDWGFYNRYKINVRLKPDLYKRLGLYMHNTNLSVTEALTDLLDTNLPKLPND